MQYLTLIITYLMLCNFRIKKIKKVIMTRVNLGNFWTRIIFCMFFLCNFYYLLTKKNWNVKTKLLLNTKDKLEFKFRNRMGIY